MKPVTKSVVRKLLRMKWRILGISLVVSLAMAMFITGLYTAVIFDHSIDTFIEETNFPDVFIELSEPADYSSVDENISGIEEIEAYSLRLKLDGKYHHNGETYQAFIIGIEDPEREDISKLLLKDGDFFRVEGEGNVVSGMEDIGAKTGETLSISIGNRSFEIETAGTVQTPEYLIAEAVPDSSFPLPGQMIVLYMDLEELQKITGYGVNDILIRVDHDQRESVMGEMGSLPISRTTYQEDHGSVVYMQIGAGKMRNMFPMFSAIFMVVGMISIFMTFYRIVMNDSRYIGVLMSLGYSRGQIIKAYMSYGTILAVIGSAVGLFFSALFTIGIMSYTITMIGDIRVAYPPDPVPFLAGLLFSFGSVLISVGIPVVLITRQTVREALDHKPNDKITTVGTMFSGLSRTRLMGIRNTFRNPIRTAITVLVIGMAIGVSGSWIVLMESSISYLNEQVEADTWDLRVDFDRPMEDDSVDDLLGVDNAEYVIPFAYLAGQVTSGKETDSTYVIASDRALEIRDFDLESGKLDLTTSVITNKLADELGIGKGDRIKITVGTAVLDTTVGGIVYDILMHAVYLDRSTASSLVAENMSMGAFIKLDDRSDAEEVAAELEMVPGVSKVTVQNDIIDAIETTFGQAMGMLYIFFVINLLIAMVVAASAIIISTMERDVEFATLDTLGIPRRKVVGSILIEIAIIGVTSALVGVPFAYIFGKIFAIVMEDVLYYFPLFFAVSTMVLTFSFGLIFVMASSIFPIRYTKKLDTETTIRERTAG